MNSLAVSLLHMAGSFNLKAEFEINLEGVTAICGASGSGKSTLLRCIAGLDVPETAKIQLASEVWNDSAKNIFAPAHKRNAVYVAQQSSLFPHLGVRENVLYGFNRKTHEQRKFTFDEVTELTGTRNLLTRKVEGLSGGEQQKVALARAIMASPKLLLMDEPFSAVDYEQRQKLIGEIAEIIRKSGIPAIIVSHSIEEVARLADKTIVLENGQIIALGKTEEILLDAKLPFVYRENALSIICGKVQKIDENVAEVLAGALAFHTTGSTYKAGDSAKLFVYAKSVVLSRKIPEETSSLNILPMNISNVIEAHPSRQGISVVILENGETRIAAHITTKSLHTLNLKPGQPIFASVKTSSVI